MRIPDLYSEIVNLSTDFDNNLYYKSEMGLRNANFKKIANKALTNLVSIKQQLIVKNHIVTAIIKRAILSLEAFMKSSVLKGNPLDSFFKEMNSKPDFSKILGVK